MERKARFLPPHEEDVLADASADRVYRHERPASRRLVGVERLDDQQLDAGEVFVLTRHDDVADDPGELHQSATSMESMMPTTAASTGQSFRPDAIRAELPLTMSTVSPTPASTVSTATRYLPSGLPRGSIGRATSSLLLTSRSSFRVATTVPTIFARIISRLRSPFRLAACLQGSRADGESRAPTPARRRAARPPRPRPWRP